MVDRTNSPDIDDLAKVGKKTLEYLKVSGWPSKRPVELLESLYDHTADLVAQGVDVDNTELPALEWAQRIKPDIKDSADAGKYVRTHLKKLNEYLVDNREQIDDALRGSGLNSRLVVSQTASVGGIKTYYYLDLEPLTTSSGEVARKLPENSIEYKVRRIEKPLPWAKPFMSLDLDGVNFYAYFGVPLLLIGFTLVWGVSIFSTKDYSLLNLYIPWIFLLGLIYKEVKPLYSLLDSRISIAPVWLVNFTIRSAQLELRATAKLRSNGRPVRELRLVVFEGKCPVCDAPVDVVQGKQEFKGRLIGQCSEAGAEHLYSFDHITKVGVPLRKNAYYGVN